MNKSPTDCLRGAAGRPPSLAFTNADNLVPLFSSLTRKRRSAQIIPWQRHPPPPTPAASVQSSAGYEYTASVLQDLTVRRGGRALCHQDLESISLPFLRPFES